VLIAIRCSIDALFLHIEYSRIAPEGGGGRLVHNCCVWDPETAIWALFLPFICCKLLAAARVGKMQWTSAVGLSEPLLPQKPTVVV